MFSRNGFKRKVELNNKGNIVPDTDYKKVMKSPTNSFPISVLITTYL